MTVVNTNVAALSAQTSMMKNTKEMESAMAKLSSGHRINNASDDAAGLSISERLESQIKGLSQAIRNSEDAQNLIDTAEGAHAEVVTSLQRLRELAVQSANSTNSAVDRSFIQKETSQLLNEINRISTNTEWNGMTLMDGSFDDKNIQVGANTGQTIAIDLGSTEASEVGNFVIRGEAKLSEGSTLASLNVVSAGNTVIAGFAGTKTIVQAVNDTAREFVEDVNGVSDHTGVTAKARTNAMIQSLSAAGTVDLAIGKQGAIGAGDATQVTVTATISDTTDLTALRNAINEVSGATGVTANFFEGDISKIMLTDNDGDDIVLGDFNHSTASSTISVQSYDFFGDSVSQSDALTVTDGTDDSVTIQGEVQLSSSQAFAVTATPADDFFGASGATDTAYQSSLEKVGDIDLGSMVGAQKALDVIDGAIDMINAQRSDLGAISNRLDKTINNLTNIVENESASKSHIKDANFASETSKLTKAQILNQAATSMLAQANASKQTVLALLQN